MESYLMYQRIVPRITYERPELPVFPIHDSLATLEGQENYVQEIMKQEISRAIHINPHFKIEQWDRGLLV
jgi:hypothetical protein